MSISIMPICFNALNEYFDKILVLTLPRLTDRIEEFRKSFEGLNYEFFYGVDKQMISLDAMKEKGIYDTDTYREFYKKPQEIPVGVLCCSLGHFNIYDYIVKNGISKTLILEDDAIPVIENIARFPQIINELPDDWELFYLGYEKNEYLGIKEKIKQWSSLLFPHHAQLHLDRDFFKKYYPVDLTPHIAKAGFHDCTHGYAVSLEGARKLLQYRQPVRFHSDNLLSFLNCTGEMNGYISRPKLFNQLSAFTNTITSLTAT